VGQWAAYINKLNTGFPLYFGIKIQGLFKDFQGPWSCIFQDQFSTEVYSMGSITATCNIYFCDYGAVLVDKNKTSRQLKLTDTHWHWQAIIIILRFAPCLCCMKLTNSTTTGTPIMSIFYVPFFREKPSLIKTELNHNKTLDSQTTEIYILFTHHSLWYHLYEIYNFSVDTKRHCLQLSIPKPVLHMFCQQS